MHVCACRNKKLYKKEKTQKSCTKPSQSPHDGKADALQAISARTSWCTGISHPTLPDGKLMLTKSLSQGRVRVQAPIAPCAAGETILVEHADDCHHCQPAIGELSLELPLL